MPTPSERLAPSLLGEVYDLEEDAYRLCVREAKRIGWGPPAIALRAVAAHANEALDALPALARDRRVRIGSALALALDTLHRIRDAVIDRFVDHEHAYRRALTALRSGIDLVHLVHASARDEGDEALAAWSRRWLETRERLVAGAADELEWFARHPFFARLPAPSIA